MSEARGILDEEYNKIPKDIRLEGIPSTLTVDHVFMGNKQHVYNVYTFSNDMGTWKKFGDDGEWKKVANE